MPVLDGVGLVAELALRGFEFPIVLMSAAALPAAVANIPNIRGFIPKPFDMEEMTHLAGSLLRAA
jgi:FixJ family two-component response regulator